MNDYRVEFSASADADFDAIQDYIARDNPLGAITFLKELRAVAVDTLSTTPDSGSRIGAYRYLRSGNYVIVDRVDHASHIVNVVLVTEGHRNWRRMFDD